MGALIAKAYWFPFKIPWVGSVLRHLLYPSARTIAPFIMVRLFGFQKLKFGKVIILTLRGKVRPIQDGADFLRKCDSEMFSRFEKQRINIIYSFDERNGIGGGRFYKLQEIYLKLGTEAMATFLVDCTLLAEASPSLDQFHLKRCELIALSSAKRKVLEWMRQRSLHPGLINSYCKIVEKWEASKRFQGLTDQLTEGVTRSSN